MTTWEIFSLGATPYRDYKNADIYDLLSNNHRLAKPNQCPDVIYTITRSCWNYEMADRPTFVHLVDSLAKAVKSRQFSSSVVEPDDVG